MSFSSFFGFTLSCEILKLHSHQFSKLLEAVHKLLVISVFRHRLPGVVFEHIDGLHILWVGEKLVYFLIRLYIVQKIVIHPFFPGLIKIIIHFHCLLHFFNFKRVFIGCFDLWDFLLFWFWI